MTLLTQHPLDLSSAVAVAVSSPDTLRTRIASHLRRFIVSRVQAVTEWNLWDGRIALWGYHSPDVMDSVGLSWWFAVDCSYEMDAGIAAQIVVMGESLCVFSRRGMDRQRGAALLAGLRQTAPGADLDAIRRAASVALREAARDAAVAAREAGGSRFWRSRPAGW